MKRVLLRPPAAIRQAVGVDCSIRSIPRRIVTSPAVVDSPSSSHPTPSISSSTAQSPRRWDEEGVDDGGGMM